MAQAFSSPNSGFTLNTVFLKIAAIIAVGDALFGIALSVLSFGASNRIIDDTMVHQARDMTDITGNMVTGSLQMMNARGVKKRVLSCLRKTTQNVLNGVALAKKRSGHGRY